MRFVYKHDHIFHSTPNRVCLKSSAVFLDIFMQMNNSNSQSKAIGYEIISYGKKTWQFLLVKQCLIYNKYMYTHSNYIYSFRKRKTCFLSKLFVNSVIETKHYRVCSLNRLCWSVFWFFDNRLICKWFYSSIFFLLQMIIAFIAFEWPLNFFILKKPMLIHCVSF